MTDEEVVSVALAGGVVAVLLSVATVLVVKACRA